MHKLFDGNVGEGSYVAAPLQGVCFDRIKIVGAAAVVTKDVPDYAIVVGNPAKVVKTLDADKFED